jgi:hypothetical protein
MPRDPLTRASTLRAIALGAVAAPLWFAWSAVSCVLADPPPELPTILPQTPFILQGSVLPPAGQIFTNWPAGGLEVYVPVTVLDPTVPYDYLLIEDYGKPNSYAPSTFPSADTYFGTFGPSQDGSANEVVPMPPIAVPLDRNCHTFSVFVGFSLSLISPASGQGYVVSGPSGLDMVTWTYDPSGDGDCAAYDAAGLTENAPDAATDEADLDAVIMPVVESGR